MDKYSLLFFIALIFLPPTAFAQQSKSDEVVIGDIEWVTAAAKYTHQLNSIRFAVPANWEREGNEWSVKVDGKTSTHFQLVAKNFGQKEIDEISGYIKNHLIEKRVIEGIDIDFIKGEMTRNETPYAVRIAAFHQPVLKSGQKMVMVLNTDSIERDAPIFEHIIASVGIVEWMFGAKELEFVETATGEAEGAISVTSNYHKATVSGYKGDNYYTVSIDLNGDGQNEWMVQARERANCYSKPQICLIYFFGHAPDGTLIDLGYEKFASISVLESSTNGYLDLAVDGALKTFNGRTYVNGQADETDERSYSKAVVPEPAKVTQTSSTQAGKSASPNDFATIDWMRVPFREARFKGVTIEIPSHWEFITGTWGTDEIGFVMLAEIDYPNIKIKGKSLPFGERVINGMTVNAVNFAEEEEGLIFHSLTAYFKTARFPDSNRLGVLMSTQVPEKAKPIYEHILQSLQIEIEAPKATETPDAEAKALVKIEESWIGVTLQDKALQGFSFDVPKEWIRAEDNWTLGTSDVPEIFVSASVHKYESDELSMITKHMREFSLSHESINSMKTIIVRGKMDQGGVMHTMKVLYFEKSNFSMIFSSSNIERDRPIFDRVLASIRFDPEQGNDTSSSADNPNTGTKTVETSGEENWEVYINSRFGSTIDFPSSLFEIQPAPGNDDGRSFKSKDGQASFLIFGSHNALSQTVKEMFGDELISETYESILEKFLDENGYFLKAVSQDQVIARRIILDQSGVIHTFQIKYPKAENSTYDPILTRMLASFATAGKKPDTTETGNASNDAAEIVFWKSISDSTEPSEFKAYLKLWPNGIFAVLARNKLDRLSGAGSDNIEPSSTLQALVSPSSYYTPKRRSKERKAIMKAARIPISRALGQDVIFVVSVLRSDSNWAFLQATPVRRDGGKINWNTTPFAKEWQNDAMSDTVMIVLRKSNGSWESFDHVIGPTDVHWYTWIDQHGLPQALFSAQ